MLKIAICDDEKEFCDSAERMLKLYMEEKGVSFQADTFGVPSDLADMTEKGTIYDIYLLDIYMPGVTGMSIATELPIYDEWNYTRLKSAPCRYVGGVDTNDIIIAGHNYKSHFGSLKKLVIGDEIEFVDAYGKSHLYEVCELITLDGTAVSDMQSSGWDFTLFTCTKGGAQRVTVRCNRKKRIRSFASNPFYYSSKQLYFSRTILPSW